MAEHTRVVIPYRSPSTAMIRSRSQITPGCGGGSQSNPEPAPEPAGAATFAEILIFDRITPLDYARIADAGLIETVFYDFVDGVDEVAHLAKRR